MMNVKLLFCSTAGGVDYEKIYTATLKEEGDLKILQYEEVDENGLTKTTITVKSNYMICVKREGLFSNYLEFKEGHFYSGEYLTPYGKIPVEAKTKYLKIEDLGGLPQIIVKYESSLMGEVSQNEFSIKMRRAV